MSAASIHPLDARFIKLALVRQYLKPADASKCEALLAERRSQGARLNAAMACLSAGLLSDDQCAELWDLLSARADGREKELIALHRAQLDEETDSTALLANEGAKRRAPLAEKPVSSTDPTVPLAPGSSESVAASPASEATDGGREVSEAASRLNLPPRQVAGCEIIEVIGRGGMGVIYRARQVHMDREIALKLLPVDMAANEKYLRRFMLEARAAGRLDHPNLVRVYDVGESSGRYYIMMEYVEGQTLKRILRREGRLEIRESLRVMEQVAAALDYAHRHGIIHRDIKPDNIMLTPKGQVKLCDLGLARVMEGDVLQDPETEEGHTMGTPHYMSPEQARGAGQAHARSDLFALGATFYHSVTGRVPFDGVSSVDILMNVIHAEPARPDRFEPLLPPPVTELILRLLAKEPSDRPGSAEAVRKEIVRLREDLEAGRLFVYEAPCKEPEQPRPVRWAWPKELARSGWTWATLAALLLFVTSLAARGARERTARPPPEVAPPAAGPLALGAERWPLEQWERRMAEQPASWPRLLAAAESLGEHYAALGAEDRRRLDALLQKAQAARQAEAKAEFSRRQVGADALSRAGLHARSAALLESLPPLLRLPENAEALRRQADAVRGRIPADSDACRKEILDLANAGLARLAGNRLASWLEELRGDGARDDDPRNAAAKELDGTLKETARKTAQEEIRAGRLADWESIRNDLARLERGMALGSARRHAETARGNAPSPEAAKLCAFHEERFTRMQELLAEAARVLGENPGRLTIADFIAPERLEVWGGHAGAAVLRLLPAADKSPQLLISSPEVEERLPGGEMVRRPGPARTVSMEVLQTAELDRLFQRLYALLIRSLDRVPELAEGRARIQAWRLASFCWRLQSPGPAPEELLTLAEQMENAARFVKLLSESAAVEKRLAARQRLARSEEWLLNGFYQLAGEEARKAAEELGAGDAAAGRAVELARLAAERLLVCAPIRGATALPRGRLRVDLSAMELARRGLDWTWTGAAPVVRPEGVLVFTAPAVAGPAWRYEAPGIMMVELEGRPQGGLELELTEEGAPAETVETWRLAAEWGAASARVALVRKGEEEPKWNTGELPAGRRHRLWVALEVGSLSWGVDSQTWGVRTASAWPFWRITLRAAGEVKLYGFRAEGRIAPFPAAERKAGGE